MRPGQAAGGGLVGKNGNQPIPVSKFHGLPKFRRRWTRSAQAPPSSAPGGVAGTRSRMPRANRRAMSAARTCSQQRGWGRAQSEQGLVAGVTAMARQATQALGLGVRTPPPWRAGGAVVPSSSRAAGSSGRGHKPEILRRCPGLAFAGGRLHPRENPEPRQGPQISPGGPGSSPLLHLGRWPHASWCASMKCNRGPRNWLPGS